MSSKSSFQIVFVPADYGEPIEERTITWGSEKEKVALRFPHVMLCVLCVLYVLRYSVCTRDGECCAMWRYGVCT